MNVLLIVFQCKRCKPWSIFIGLPAKWCWGWRCQWLPLCHWWSR